MKLFGIFSFFGLMVLMSCTKDPRTDILTKPAECDNMITDSTAFSYENDIRPIITLNCTGPTCHIPSTTNVNYDFTDYNILANRIRNGVFEYRLLLPMDDPQHMPQTGPPYPVGYNLNVCDLYKIRAWIRQGYPNN